MRAPTCITSTMVRTAVIAITTIRVTAMPMIFRRIDSRITANSLPTPVTTSIPQMQRWRNPALQWLDRSDERDGNFSESAEIGLEHVAGLNRQRRMAGACRHHLACFQRNAELPQFIGQPRQRDAGIAEHIAAVADKTPAAQR